MSGVRPTTTPPWPPQPEDKISLQSGAPPPPGDRFRRVAERLGRYTNHPVLRGGLVIGSGIFAGNVLGFLRSAVTAYLLGTHAAADGLAVALGPIDTLNSVLINTIVFAFVPLLTAVEGGDRVALFYRAARLFSWIFCSVAAAIFVFAPRLIHALGPGLDSAVYPQAVNLVRITACSSLAVGVSALASALLYTERRFGPSAFYQAVLNLFVIAGALLFWRKLGVYGFALGYTGGALAQLAIVSSFARQSRRRLLEDHSRPSLRSPSAAKLLAKPGSFLVYAGLLALNIIATRAYATQAGPGMAAAFDYCLRGVNVLIAYLVSPASNSLLPEIARMRSEGRAREAFRLLDRTLAWVAGVAVAGCLAGLALRKPIFAVLFERGNFTADSTALVSAVFLGLAPSLIGWSLIEIASRSLFALDRPVFPMVAAALSVGINILVSARMHSPTPERIGLGSSVGLLLGFLFLFAMLRVRRKSWTSEMGVDVAPPGRGG